ncbi:RidA family protein [Hypericibacter sp.]|uniref:RidA family protein n=1 Tax=Hypericibacter sp. TaxID=2705401 RepID=UPI003D6D983D
MFKRIPNQLIGGFSDAVVVDMGDYSTIYISGMIGHDASGKITAKDFEGETQQCWGNIARGLERAGASLKDVVRITAYLTDLNDYAVYAKARRTLFEGNPPASATVQVAGLLLNARLEVDAIAIVKHARAKN